MAKKVYLLDERAARRVRRQVQAGEALVRPEQGQRDAPAQFAGVNLNFVTISSATKSGGPGGNTYYPGHWFTFDPLTATLTQQAVVWVCDVNGAPLSTGTYYEADQRGDAGDGKLVWLTDRFNGGTVSGSVTIASGGTLTLASGSTFVLAGPTWNITQDTTATVSSGKTMTFARGGTGAYSITAPVTVNPGGTFTLASGTNFTVSSGVTASITLGSGSTLDLAAVTGQVTDNTTFTVSTGKTWTFAGSGTGAVSFTAPVTFSGALTLPTGNVGGSPTFTGTVTLGTTSLKALETVVTTSGGGPGAISFAPESTGEPTNYFLPPNTGTATPATAPSKKGLLASWGISGTPALYYSTGTSTSADWKLVALGTSGVSIGDTVGSSTDKCVLFIDGTSLAQYTTGIGFKFNKATGGLSVQATSGGTAGNFYDDSGNFFVNLGVDASAAIFGDGTQQVTVCTGAYAIEINPGDLRFTNGGNVETDTTNGTVIATSASQLLAFWGATPVAQYSGAGAAPVGFTQNAGGPSSSVDNASTFTGGTGSTTYTIGELVYALKLAGIIAT